MCLCDRVGGGWGLFEQAGVEDGPRGKQRGYVVKGGLRVRGESSRCRLPRAVINELWLKEEDSSCDEEEVWGAAAARPSVAVCSTPVRRFSHKAPRLSWLLCMFALELKRGTSDPA